MKANEIEGQQLHTIFIFFMYIMQKQTIASFDATNQWFAAAPMLLSVTESVKELQARSHCFTLLRLKFNCKCVMDCQPGECVQLNTKRY